MPQAVYTSTVRLTDVRMASSLQSETDPNYYPAAGSTAVPNSSARVVGGTRALSDGSDSTFAKGARDLDTSQRTRTDYVWGRFEPTVVPAKVKYAYDNGYPVTVAHSTVHRGFCPDRSDPIINMRIWDDAVTSNRFQNQRQPILNNTRFAQGTTPVTATQSQTRTGGAGDYGVFRSFAQAGILEIYLSPTAGDGSNPPTTPGMWTWTTHEWSFVTQWTITEPNSTSQYVPTRLYPRSDGLGTSSAPRLYGDAKGRR